MAGPFSVKRAGDHKILLTVAVALTVLGLILVSAPLQGYLGGQTVQSGTPSYSASKFIQSVEVYANGNWTVATITGPTATGFSIELPTNAKVTQIDVVSANTSFDLNKLLNNNEVTYEIGMKAPKGINSVYFEMGTFLNGTTSLNKLSTKQIQNQVFNTTIFGSSVNDFNTTQVMPLMASFGGDQAALPMLQINGNITTSTNTSTPTTLTLTYVLYKTANMDLWTVYDVVMVAIALLSLFILFMAYPRRHGM